MGLLQATCIMPNSSGWFHSVPYAAASSSPQLKAAAAAADRGDTLTWVPYIKPGTSLDSDPSLLQDGGEDLGTDEHRLSPNGASCGYPSNTDYYVVPLLTLMGCYNDLK